MCTPVWITRVPRVFYLRFAYIIAVFHLLHVEAYYCKAARCMSTIL